MNPGIAYVTFGKIELHKLLVYRFVFILTMAVGVAQRMALTLGLHAESFIFKDPGANKRQDLW
jgi:hypothetical protein